jgi:hypothetical protein
MHKGVLCGTLKCFPPLRETMDVEDPEGKEREETKKEGKEKN